MRRLRHTTKLKSMKDLNITSLIDVMFILVIFFMVSSTLVVHPGMRVKMPEAKNSKTVQQHEMTVYVDENNIIYFNNDKVDKTGLKNKIFSNIENGGKPQITVKADKKVNYEIIIQVIDIAKESGVQDISFAAKKTDKINYE
ncbi:biopolymer transporter ExbD [Candidatus Dependentiae bacterium]|nr:biopolymer transporter ExbD [Candidatus Dependentiae bacterium]